MCDDTARPSFYLSRPPKCRRSGATAQVAHPRTRRRLAETGPRRRPPGALASAASPPLIRVTERLGWSEDLGAAWGGSLHDRATSSMRRRRRENGQIRHVFCMVAKIARFFVVGRPGIPGRQGPPALPRGFCRAVRLAAAPSTYAACRRLRRHTSRVETGAQAAGAVAWYGRTH